jgi:hypothetical protein
MPPTQMNLYLLMFLMPFSAAFIARPARQYLTIITKFNEAGHFVLDDLPVSYKY